MQNNIIDLIIYLARRMHIGVQLSDIRVEKLPGYNKSEISAALSWLIQKNDSGEFNRESKVFNRTFASPRLLHSSEKNHISTEVYGYLLELYYLNIINADDMERLIEYAMFHLDGKTDTSVVKAWVTRMIFDHEYTTGDRSRTLLKGNETIH